MVQLPQPDRLYDHSTSSAGFCRAKWYVLIYQISWQADIELFWLQWLKWTKGNHGRLQCVDKMWMKGVVPNGFFVKLFLKVKKNNKSVSYCASWTISFANTIRMACWSLEFFVDFLLKLLSAKKISNIISVAWRHCCQRSMLPTQLNHVSLEVIALIHNMFLFHTHSGRDKTETILYATFPYAFVAWKLWISIQIPPHGVPNDSKKICRYWYRVSVPYHILRTECGHHYAYMCPITWRC